MCIDVWEKIKFSDRVVAQCGKRYTILHDVNSMKTTKITTEAYGIVKDICENQWKIEHVIKKCESEEDKKYLFKVLQYLEESGIIRKHNDHSEYKDMDIRIDLDITNRCNLHCKHCCVSASIENEDMSTENMLDIIRKVAAIEPKAVIISGGEPLIREDFKMLINALRSEYKGFLALMTNAVLITEDLAFYISKNFDAVSVSLDGVDEETCSAIRGKGVFKKIIAGIKLLQKAGVKKISASMVVSKVTYNKKHEFRKLCNDLEVDAL